MNERSSSPLELVVWKEVEDFEAMIALKRCVYTRASVSRVRFRRSENRVGDTGETQR